MLLEPSGVHSSGNETDDSRIGRVRLGDPSIDAPPVWRVAEDRAAIGVHCPVTLERISAGRIGMIRAEPVVELGVVGARSGIKSEAIAAVQPCEEVVWRRPLDRRGRPERFDRRSLHTSASVVRAESADVACRVERARRANEVVTVVAECIPPIGHASTRHWREDAEAVGAAPGGRVLRQAALGAAGGRRGRVAPPAGQRQRSGS